jgi:gamma-glutamyltranspeptidase/glutathione hydrolase
MITSRPQIVGVFGVVASTHWLATTTAMAVLEKGGNAFDAAVAAGLVLQIIEPDQNGPGGDVPAILWSNKKNKVEVVCGQGVAPAAADIDYFERLSLDMIPGNGHLPAVVPGAFGAWMLILRDYGELSLREVLEPAIRVSRDGFVITPAVAAILARVAPFFRKFWPSSAEVYLSRTSPHRAGELLCLPEHGKTYERILQEAEASGSDRVNQIEAARRAWYEGFVAEAIDKFQRCPVMDTTGSPNVGLLTGQDLAQWHPTIEEPIAFDYGDYKVCKVGPWSQGPVFLQQLALLQQLGVADMDPLGAQFVHTVQECCKLSFADREAFYGDPKFVDVPTGRLLSRSYSEHRASLVGATASRTLRPGTDVGKLPEMRLREKGATTTAHVEMIGFEYVPDPVRPDVYFEASQGDTCHLDIIDRWGNMISATPSGGWLSGSPAVPGLGFPISSRGQIFTLNRDHPNALAPGKRPRTTLSPGLALRRGEPYMVFGTPGADSQDQWALHAFLRHVDGGYNLQEAIDAPSFFTQHSPASFYPHEWRPGHLAIESGFSRLALKELDRRGHDLEIYPKWGHYNSVTMATRDGRQLRAAASPRRMQCYAIGR